MADCYVCQTARAAVDSTALANTDAKEMHALYSTMGLSVAVRMSLSPLLGKMPICTECAAATMAEIRCGVSEYLTEDGPDQGERFLKCTKLLWGEPSAEDD